METKELKVQAPEGYEIDKENSTFECIRFKPIKKNITYEDVCNKLFEKNSGYSINQYGKIDNFCLALHRFDANNAPEGQQLKRLLALNQLLNIAEYYNSNRKEDEVTYAIIYDFDEVRFTTTSSILTDIYSFGVVAVFYDENDAQAVIDNPNFREILDTIYKD